MSRTPRPRTFLTVLIAAVVLIAGINFVAQAAGDTGKPVLAGKVTKSGKDTVLQRTKKGPALQLRTKKNSPPLAVNSSKKVAKLNADRLDGRDAAALETRTFSYQLPPGGTPSASQSAVFPGLPNGTYLVNYAVTLSAGATITTAQCFVRQPGASTVAGLAYATIRGSFATTSSSGRVDTSAGAIELRCSASTPIVFDDTDAGGVVTFTRTSIVENTATAPTSGSARKPGTPNGGAATGR